MLQEDIDRSVSNMRSGARYDSPGWSEMTAEELGAQKALLKVIELISDKH